MAERAAAIDSVFRDIGNAGEVMGGEHEGVALWGQSLYERQQDPLLWAGEVLQGVAEALGMEDSPDVRIALRLVSERDEGGGARAAFDQIRRRRLHKGNSIVVAEGLLLRLAEIVAKIAHNESGGTPPFDYDAGWQVGPIVYRMVSEVPGFTRNDLLFSSLGGWPTKG
ncbi:hypothetical protein ACIBL6_20285 [Streptomyces sp. NPDC050400]|uniref:hypothetical protein n=1 Tax=Streptomyces sp. NPDC050400 TaxID=3365610 RepID=UPI003795DDB0